MVLLHATSSQRVDSVLHTTLSTGSPFLLLVYSNDCGHCTRLMPAFRKMLALLSPSDCIVKLAISALRTAKESRAKHMILDQVSGVPFIAMMHGNRIVPLPNTSDRSAKSLLAFANRHFKS